MRSTPRSTTGSSPRVRGTDPASSCWSGPARFIPACAGNSRSDMGLKGNLPVHPRVCGEQLLARTAKASQRGSSPRVRGTGHQGFPTGWVNRFIPACAGNSCRLTDARRTTSVHPRVCGEQGSRRNARSAAAGSSPRVRGTGQAGSALPRRQRFIPACAGNRCRSTPAMSISPVHPRVCGEQANSRSARVFCCGSSPRVRGTAEDPDAIANFGRFIPACAGNSAVR